MLPPGFNCMGTVQKGKKTHEKKHFNVALVFVQIAWMYWIEYIEKYTRNGYLGGMKRWKLTLKSFETSSIIIIIQFVLCVWVYLCTRTLAWNMTTIKWCKWTFQMEFMCWSFVEFQMNIKFMSGEAVMQSIHICACAISMSCFCVQCVCVCCGITHIQYICICTIYFIWKWQQVASRVEPIML